jgi:hypothetical protein
MQPGKDFLGLIAVMRTLGLGKISLSGRGSTARAAQHRDNPLIIDALDGNDVVLAELDVAGLPPTDDVAARHDRHWRDHRAVPEKQARLVGAEGVLRPVGHFGPQPLGKPRRLGHQC